MEAQLAAWQTDQLRLTAFPSPSARIIEPRWWHDVMGEEPESRISQPRKGGYREEGPFAEGKLLLAVEPTRIDWLFIPLGDEKRQTEGFLTIGPFLEALDALLPVIRRWFEHATCPAVQRLAFGAVLLQPVQDLQSGYRQLVRYLPSIPLDPEGSSDFLYQINRPRDSTSGLTGLRINRLSKWSVGTAQWQEFSVGLASIQHSPSRAYFACRLELDMNTSAEFPGELLPTHLSPIFQELVDLGREIAREGDLP